MKCLRSVFIASLILLFAGINGYSRPTQKIVTPTYTDDGNKRESYKITVTSSSAIGQPFDVSEGGWFRSALYQNTSSLSDVLIATFSTFTPEYDAYIVLGSTPNAISLSDNTSAYMKVSSGAVSATVVITAVGQR